MSYLSWTQLFVFFAILALLTKYVGLYLYKVLTPSKKTGLERIFGSLEKGTYKLVKIDTEEQHTWKQYLARVIAVSAVSFLFTFVLIALQPYLPFNPEKLKTPSLDLLFNISAGFLTNTDWQSYSGENTLSYFSQMAALTVQNFVSPAIGLTVAAALVRGIAGSNVRTLGNFWVDLIRICYYLLLPLSIVFALFFLSQGVPQNLRDYVNAETLDTQLVQSIAQGPMASQEAIKILGSNGGGFTNANSAHPYENPNFLSNFIQMLGLLLLPAAQTYYYGKSVRNQKHGWSLFIAMSILLVAGTVFMTQQESTPNPLLSSCHIDPTLGNMEGKEMRFGLLNSTLFTTATTCAANGSVNSIIDSYSPLGGMVALLNIQLGETIFGAVGSGLYSIVLLVILAVYLAGLIIGKTPEYLGKKIDIFDIKMTMLPLVLFIFIILSCTAWASTSLWGVRDVVNAGSHGFTEILYSFSSATGNNGSSMVGLSANTFSYNVVVGFVMLLARFIIIVPVLALAGSLGRKPTHPPSTEPLPLSGITFVLLLIGVLLVIGALSYLPSLLMGPILEHIAMYQS